jgi:hypothetical protein
MKSVQLLPLFTILTAAAAGAAPVVSGDNSRVGSVDGAREAIERIDARCRSNVRPAACEAEMAERIGAYLAAKTSRSERAAAHTEALLSAFEKEDALLGAQIRQAVELGARLEKPAGEPSPKREPRALVASNEKPQARVAGGPLLLASMLTGCIVTTDGGGGGGYDPTTCTYSNADPNMDTRWKKNFRAGVYWGCNDYYFGYWYEPEIFYGYDTSYFDYWYYWNDYTVVTYYSCFDAGYSDGWDDFIFDAGYRFTCWDDVLFY